MNPYRLSRPRQARARPLFLPYLRLPPLPSQRNAFGLKPQGRKKLQAAEPAVPTAPRQAACSKPVLALAPGLPGPLAFQTFRRPSARIRPSANRLRCSLTSISRRSPREPLLGLRRLAPPGRRLFFLLLGYFLGVPVAPIVF